MGLINPLNCINDWWGCPEQSGGCSVWNSTWIVCERCGLLFDRFKRGHHLSRREWCFEIRSQTIFFRATARQRN